MSISTTTTSIGSYHTSSTISSNTNANLHVNGDAIVTGTLKVGGQNITKTIDERLTVIEERLAILRLDPDLESRWDELKAAREHYMKLEVEFKSYERVIDILKT
jgi:hypothetical protein